MKDYHCFAMCVGMMHDDYYDHMIRAFCRAAEERGMQLLIFGNFHSLDANNHFDLSAGIYQLIPYTRVEGVILFPEAIKNDSLCKAIADKTRAQGLPVVSVDYEIAGCYNIRFGYADVFEQIVRHMVAYHGYRRINLIAGMKGNPFEQERTKAYRKVLTDYGIPVEEERIGYGDFWSDPTYRVVDHFIESDLPFPEVIVCENDSMALACCKRLREHGIEVPGNVCVSGLDGISAALNHVPRITTAIQNREAAAETACGLLLSLANGTCTQDIDQPITVPFTPMYQTSCGCYNDHLGSNNDDLIEAYRKWDRTMGNDDFVDQMKNGAIGTADLGELREKIYKKQQWNNWKCVRADFPSVEHTEKEQEFCFENPVFPEKMKVFLRLQEDNYELEEEYPTATLLPCLDDVLERVKHLVFIPYHFVHRVFGYEVLEFSSDSYVDFDFERRMMNAYNLLLKILQDETRVRHITEALEEKNREMQKLYEQDYLTGLYNRRGFYARIENAAEQLKEEADHGNGMSLLLFSIDMDGLKKINDTYGHKEGDFSLKTIADVLRTVSVKWPNMICARFGGDEFVAAGFFAGQEAVAAETAIRECFERELQQANERSYKQYFVGASMGSRIASCMDEFRLEAVINDADHRMYAEKERRKANGI